MTVVADTPAVWGTDSNTMVLAQLAAIRAELRQLSDALAAAEPLLAQVPELAATITAVLAGARKSPQLRMLGIKLPPR